ncbi:MAG: hypothetical protein A3F10_00475 [Coxiella sp. RIFCSPHIGHO2_12_FULL_42_15]|nr:MAG: hypothetical protein A3F10_00475 [Coxiella sp. RIFCSPHIGHO2_12_FULL_42_15]
MQRNFVLAILLFLTSPLAFATTAYQFELIVFAHIDAASFQSEQWSALSKESVNVNSTLNSGVTLLSPAQFVLTDEQRRLNQYSHYETLLHLAWRESLTELNKSHSIHLYGGHLYDNDGHIIQTSSNESLPYSPSQHWQLNGKVTVRLERYFDLNFNLLLAVPSHEVAKLTSNSQMFNLSQPFTYIQLAQRRRSRSQELNYLDHPLYGVLFKIVPINE